MQPSKKISMIEFFYLALLLTSTRPPDQQNLLPRIRSLRPVAQESGALIADDYYYANSLRNDLVNNGIFSTKSSILLHETLDALDVINSLGRYGRPYSSNLIAFPVSQGFSNDGLIDGVIEESDDPGSFRLSNEPLNSLSDDIFGLNISESDLDFWGDFDDEIDSFNQQLRSSSLFESEDSSDSTDLRFLCAENGSINITSSLPPSSPILSSSPLARPDQEIESSDDDAFESAASIQNYFLHEDRSSVMLPVLNSGDGDVNDLFNELEFLLSNETDRYGQEWPLIYQTENDIGSEFSSSSYQNALTDVNNSGSELCTDRLIRLDNDEEDNLGSVLYSSMTTLNGDYVCPQPSQMNQSSDLLAGNIFDQSQVGNQRDFLHLYYSNKSSEFSSIDIGECGPRAVENYEKDSTFHSQSRSSNVSKNSIQDQQDSLFDKSSDSAVSSMSSERLPSFSDNDLIETSSETSSLFNGYDFVDRSNRQNKTVEFCQNSASIDATDFDYSNLFNSSYNSFTSSIDDSNPNQQHMNYFQPRNDYSIIEQNIAHNHTYAHHNPSVEMKNEISSTENHSTELSSIPWISSLSPNENEHEIPKQRKKNNKLKKSSRQTYQGETVKTDMLTEDDAGDDDHNCPTSNNFDNHFNRDEKRARALNLPLTVQEIIDLPIDEFNERLTRYELSEVQLSLIRDIRRRGKNKVAAQNCRKRKLDQIMGLQSEVDNMYLEKETLQNEYNRLIILREMARDKYAKLYHFVIEASSSKQSYYQLSSSPPDFPVRNSTNEILIDQNESNNFVASQNVSTPLSFMSSPQMIQSEALKNSN
ncbi:hypothetical protein NH340_JMT04171 [Sarcoptes scabiei]|nr:hypothetical protein NH340_JMT04171 [Sarcoptes scabiei]